MIARLLISKSTDARNTLIAEFLRQTNLTKDHPDLLFFPSDSKLGIEQARKIKEHFSLKPFSAKGRVVILENGGNLTLEAQNALLKIIEELPVNAGFLIGTNSEANLLPTVISRCEVIRVRNAELRVQNSEYEEDIEKIINSGVEERFEYVEKLKEKEEFLHLLISYFHQNLESHHSKENLDFIKELLQTEEWAHQNVNLRAILEYLMLVMPT